MRRDPVLLSQRRDAVRVVEVCAAMSMDDKTRIDVLMKEYDTLRAEILVRMQSKFAVTTLIGSKAASGLDRARSVARSW